MPYLDGRFVSRAEWEAAQPAKPRHIPTLEGEPPAIDSPTVGQSANAVGAAPRNKPNVKAAALAATGVALPPGIELAEGTTDIPPVSQADNGYVHTEEDDDESIEVDLGDVAVVAAEEAEEAKPQAKAVRRSK